ncbi:MAG: DUF1634 domain-containing protein [Caulobacteraceae bacterium]
MTPVSIQPGKAVPQKLERLLAIVLQQGVWLACGLIAVGLALGPLGVTAGAGVTAAGIGLLILLPVLRVALMLAVFVRERDYPLGAIAALVLTIILLGFACGVLLARSAA